MHRQRILTASLVAAFWLCGHLGAQEAAEKKEAPPGVPATAALAIESIAIEPASPAADTLCQLRVKLASSAEGTISALDFGVAIGGVALQVYDKQLFLETVAPGKTTEVRLYNFWTTETGRPAPASGKLELEVTLRAAQWVEITTEEDGTEVWTLGEAVPGLPVVKKLIVALQTSSRP